MTVQLNTNNMNSNISLNVLNKNYKNQVRTIIHKNLKAIPSLTPLMVVSAMKTNPLTLSDFGSALFHLPIKITGAFLAAKAINKLAMMKIKAKKEYLSKNNKELNANPAIVIGSEIALTWGLYNLGKLGLIKAENSLKKLIPLKNTHSNSTDFVNSTALNKKIYQPVAEKISNFFITNPKLKKPFYTLMTIGALSAAFYKPAKLTMEFFKSKNEDTDNAKENIKELIELRKKYKYENEKNILAKA